MKAKRVKIKQGKYFPYTIIKKYTPYLIIAIIKWGIFFIHPRLIKSHQVYKTIDKMMGENNTYMAKLLSHSIDFNVTLRDGLCASLKFFQLRTVSYTFTLSDP